MGDLSDMERELDKEREKLGRMINEARKSRQPSNEAILEQSRKVDELLIKIQKAPIDRSSKVKRPRKGQER